MGFTNANQFIDLGSKTNHSLIRYKSAHAKVQFVNKICDELKINKHGDFKIGIEKYSLSNQHKYEPN